jgi:CubicO group peptidase (beta-lactamase class C family)
MLRRIPLKLWSFITCILIAFAANADGIDGQWKGTLKCGPLLVRPPSSEFSMPISMTVTGKEAVTLRQTDQYKEQARGSINGSGAVSLAGEGRYNNGSSTWATRLQGQFTGNRFTASGGIFGIDGTKRRECNVDLTQTAGTNRSESAPAPITGSSTAVVVADSHRPPPDEEMLGKSRGYPVPSSPFNELDDAYKVGGYSNLDKAFDTRTIKRGSHISSLPKDQGAPSISYAFKGATYSIDDYLARQRTTSILVVKDGKIVFERYQYDRNDGHRMHSQSMAKSITSLLVGAALDEGKIKSIDDLAEHYVTDLKGTALGKASIRNLLQMSSGASFLTQVGAADSDVYRLTMETYYKKGCGGASAVSWVREGGIPGTKFNYSNADTFTLGLVVRHATNISLSDYASEKLWQPIGAESDATWLVDWAGVESAFTGFSAVARDYARLGILLANDGQVNGKQVVSSDFLKAATDMSMQPQYLRAKAILGYYGYGYQYWLLPYRTRTFMMMGIMGQAIYVQPESKLVMVVTSVWKDRTGNANDAAQERNQLWAGVLKSLGGRIDLY